MEVLQLIDESTYQDRLFCVVEQRKDTRLQMASNMTRGNQVESG